MSTYAQKITSWSYSRLSVYEECPRKAKYKFILKMPEPKSPAMDRGDAVHKKIAAFIKGTARNAPSEAGLFKDDIKRLRASFKLDAASGATAIHERGVSIEETWAFTKSWTQTVYNDWNGCWLRIKTDASSLEGDVVTVNDWKTGRYHERNVQTYLDQTKLYATGALTLYAPIGSSLRVRTRLVFLDAGIAYPQHGETIEYKPTDLKGLKKDWERRAGKMMNDAKFAPTPSQNACRFCHFKKDNGGPCEY